MAFFSIGDNYRGTYQIESVEPFFEGELAVASSGGERFFLQLTRLQKPAPPRAIQQYLSLKDHPLIVPYLQVYSEERSLVMIRPFVPFAERLHERIARGELEEDQILDWVRRLFPVEEVLKEKPLRMYTVLHPANIGLTESGQVQVLYCGVEGRTLPDPKVDWGNLLYMLFSGEMLDQPIKKLPPDHGFSKPLEKMIQRSFHRPAGSVASNLDSYLKKRDAKGFFDFLKPKFSPKETPSQEPPAESPPDSAASESSFPPEGPSSDVLRRRLEETRRAKEEAERRAQEEAARLEQERLERERQEQERREREEAERRAQEEAARLEQERLEQERREREEGERRAQEEAARLERERQEQERREREEGERRAQEKAARLERERVPAGHEEQLERARAERLHHDRLAAQFEEYVRHVFNRQSPGND